MTRVPKSIAHRMKFLIDNKKTDELNKMLSKERKRGARPVLIKEEQSIFKKRILFAVGRGFAVDINSFRAALGRMAADCRKGFRNRLPSAAAVRAYRAHNGEISYRKHRANE